MKPAAIATAGTPARGPRAVALIVLLCAPLLPIALADGPVPLRWGLEPGRVISYTLSQETSLDSKPEGGRTVHSERRQEVDLRWVVDKVEEDSADVSLFVDRIRVHVARDGRPADFVFDTATDAVPDDDPYSSRLAFLLKALAGSRVTFRLAPRGEVRDVRLPDELLAAMRRAGPAEAASIPSEAGIRNLIVQAVPFLPEGLAGPGTTWARQVAAPMPMLGSLILDKTYTDRGPRPGRPEVHDVDVETRFTLQPMPGSELEVKLVKQSGVGSFAFDARRGLVEACRLEDSLTTCLTADGRRVEQFVSTRIELKLAPEPAPAPPPR